jgi:peptidylprolyl isomerase
VTTVPRVPALLAILCLSLSGLTACGDDDGDSGNSGKVAVSGDFGKEPTVTFDGRVERKTTEYETLVEGSGPEVKEGDTVFLNYYQGNGYTQTKAASSYDKGQQPFMLEVTKDLFKAFHDGIVGHTAGSRVQVLATPKDAFGGNGNPDVGIGNADSVVLVIDIMDLVRKAPVGAESQLPAGLPTLTEKDGKPTAFDFSKAAKSAGPKLRTVTLVEGDGPAIAKKGSQVALRYLGQVWGAKKSFDSNYAAAGPGFPNQQGGIDPATIPGALIDGWNKGLVGVTAGSRVMLVIPSKLGYGEKGSGKQIKPGDDLVFVVDVLGVA